jgi:hypothetical protein
MAFFRKLFCLPAQPVNHFIMNLPLTKLTCLLAIISISLLACTKTEKPAENSTPENEWVSLWDGETLNGWEAAENPEAFTIEEGKIVVNGTRGHLFYQGPVANANFDDFEFKAEVYTMPDANSGIFFHTKYQEEGWPSNGYEAQVNATYDPDPRKTGSRLKLMANPSWSLPSLKMWKELKNLAVALLPYKLTTPKVRCTTGIFR